MGTCKFQRNHLNNADFAIELSNVFILHINGLL